MPTLNGLFSWGLLLLLQLQCGPAQAVPSVERQAAAGASRERISINNGWRFSRFTTAPDSLSYTTLKPYMLASSNDYSSTPHARPSGTAPTATQAQSSFDDSSWELLNLPHDWAIKGPFGAPGVSGGMGRLPSNGVGWYRRKISMAANETGKSFFIDIDGAQSYAAVWLNGNLVGGWPYGYASFRLDLTPYMKAGDDNLLAVRLDNPTQNSRWYPGAGIYRNVWLVKVDPVHVAYSGTYITTPTISTSSATVNLAVTVENKGTASRQIDVTTEIHVWDPTTKQASAAVVATIASASGSVAAGSKQSFNGTTTVANPQLWGPQPQKPNLYVAVTTIRADNTVIDTYETRFGIRSITYDANKGVLVNGQRAYVQGTCNHHDQGSLGAAFHVRAAERQIGMLQEMGGNALRTSHNPPAPEFLDIADQMGMMVLDEIFDCWASQKTANDFHLIFNDWHEADLRNFIRRDRNHPSVIAWSIGNEVGEQGSASGGTIGTELHNIARSEDPTRLSTAAMNSASAGSAIANAMDIIGLNYQGEGTGSGTTSGSFGNFHKQYPNKVIWSSESSSAVSSRGYYLFPVTSANSATVGSNSGGNSAAMQVSDYGLYAVSWGGSPDKVFKAQDAAPYVGGEFVWTGFDYIGEPTPYDNARSSYFGIIDLAGFKKDRFYLYQARWRPDFPMAHILPHWTWPDRVGQVTPVHVFSAADEVELFVNGKSAGRQKRPDSSWRFRWDTVTYQPGDLKAVAYKNGQQWAVDTKRTVGAAAALNMTVDRTSISADGYDLAYVTVAVADSNGDTVPTATNSITYSISGPGEIVSTDNGDPTDMTAFPSLSRKAFAGLTLAIVRAKAGSTGQIVVTANATGLTPATATFQAA